MASSRDLLWMAETRGMPSGVKVLLRVYAWCAKQRERLHWFIHTRHYGRDAERAEAEVKRRDALYGDTWRDPYSPLGRRLAKGA